MATPPVENRSALTKSSKRFAATEFPMRPRTSSSQNANASRIQGGHPNSFLRLLRLPAGALLGAGEVDAVREYNGRLSNAVRLAFR